MMLYYGGQPVFTSMGGGLAQVADIYSEEEQVVGTWIDGKPVYRKAYKLVNQSIPYANPTDVMLRGDIEYIINQSGYYEFSDLGVITGAEYVRVVLGPQYVALIQRWSNVTRVINGVLVIEYTKTTDQPGSPTLLTPGNTYSKEEQIVGTWIDGKPIYRQVFDNSVTNGTVLVEGVDSLVSVSGAFLYDGRVFNFPFHNSNATNCEVLFNSNRVTFGVNGFPGFSILNIILEYTKVS